MKRFSLILMAALLGLSVAGCSGGDDEPADAAGGQAAATPSVAAEQPVAQSEGTGEVTQSGDAGVDSGLQDFSYALGMNIASSLEQIKAEVDAEQVAQGLRDALSGGGTRLTDQEADQILQAKAQQIQAEQMAARQQQSQQNLEASQAFLAENKQQEGVKVTDSGLQYQVLREGDGPQPTEEDVVVVDYEGTLPDGTVFDSSYERGEPATFPVAAVIPGWTEALQMMHVGSKYRLVIPPELAYGEQGAGQLVGSNQVLIFEVELKDIQGGSGSGSGDGGAGEAASAAPQ